MNDLVDGPVTIHVGHVLDVLRAMPAESVHCAITSPPYWGLRDYGTATWEGGDPTCGHKSVNEHQKQGATSLRQGRSNVEEQRSDYIGANVCAQCGAVRVEPTIWGGMPGCAHERSRDSGNVCAICGAWRGALGLEPTPDIYVRHMVEVFREVRRVLRKDGTLWLNLGDSYASSSTYNTTNSLHDEHGWKQDGDHRPNVRANQIGLKPKDLVGIPWRVAFALQADGWYLRSDIIWSKPNPMPESVTDRPTKAHEYLFLLTKNGRYFYDEEAIREEPAGYKRNKRSVWEIATQPYPEAHFATFPEDLVIPCVKAGTSEHGCCARCGAPWERVIEKDVKYTRNSAGHSADYRENSAVDGGATRLHLRPEVSTTTTGWQPTCKHYGADLRIVSSPTGDRAGEDPTMTTGRRGMNRPRGEDEGSRPITRHEQAVYAKQLRESPHRVEMEQEVGEAFAHYIRTDDSGARPLPAAILGAWIGRGWLVPVEVPGATGEVVPCTVLDPFAGSGTTLAVARRLGRRSVGIELQQNYLPLIEKRITEASLPLLEGLA